MKLVWLMLLILYFKESQSKISTYPTPGRGLSFLCGCASDTQYNKNIPIKCRDRQVIQMEPFSYLMRNNIGNYSDCGNLNYTTCKRFRPTVISLDDRIHVYKKCSLKNSCDIKIAGEQQGKERLVNYPFYCQSVHDLSDKVSKSNNPILYFTGKKYKGQTIDCDCSASSSAPIRLEIFFIHLKPHTCSKVKFLSGTHQLFGCSTRDTAVLYISSVYIGIDLKLEIREMEPDVEDVLYFKLWGSDLTVTCGGCRDSTDGGFPTPSKSSIDTSTKPPATYLTTSTALTSSDPDSFNGERTTTEDSILDGPVPAASTGQTDSTAILGGILAAVIIINIVGIALYCFFRRRRKQQKKSRNTLTNVPGNGEQSQYNYIDITPDEPNYINSTQSNLVQNGDHGISPDSIESILRTSGSKDRPNNQYHVLEVDTYSEPANRRGDTGANQKRGRKQDDYDHINDDSKFKPTVNDTYNHIDTTLNITSLSDDYNHIGDQNGLSKGKLELIDVAKNKKKRTPKNQENTSYVNGNMETDEALSSTEDVDTYNHLQH